MMLIGISYILGLNLLVSLGKGLKRLRNTSRGTLLGNSVIASRQSLQLIIKITQRNKLRERILCGGGEI